MAADSVPDETTILNLRHLLEEHQLPERFFALLNEHLREQGLQLERGTIVDATNGLVHSLRTGTAKTHDIRLLEGCLHGEEEAVFGDKGYADKKRKQQCRAQGIYYGILDQATRGTSLSTGQKKRN